MSDYSHILVTDKIRFAYMYEELGRDEKRSLKSPEIQNHGRFLAICRYWQKEERRLGVSVSELTAGHWHQELLSHMYLPEYVIVKLDELRKELEQECIELAMAETGRIDGVYLSGGQGGNIEVVGFGKDVSANIAKHPVNSDRFEVSLKSARGESMSCACIFSAMQYACSRVFQQSRH